MIAGTQTIADDRRIAGDQRSVFPYDRRRSQNFLRSAIYDPRSSAIIWKPALTAKPVVVFEIVKWFLENVRKNI